MWKYINIKFVEASDWFTAHNKGNILYLCRRGLKPEILFAKSAPFGNKGYFAGDGTYFAMLSNFANLPLNRKYLKK